MPENSLTTAARNSESELWQHYRLTNVERFVETEQPRPRVRMLESASRGR